MQKVLYVSFYADSDQHRINEDIETLGFPPSMIQVVDFRDAGNLGFTNYEVVLYSEKTHEVSSSEDIIMRKLKEIKRFLSWPYEPEDNTIPWIYDVSANRLPEIREAILERVV